MKQLVIDAVNHKESGVIPYNIELTAGFIENVKKRYGCADVDDFLGNSMTRTKYKRNRVLDNGDEVDIYGVVWQKSEDGGDVGNVRSYPMEDGGAPYTFPDVDDTAVKNALEKIKAETKRFRMFGVTMSFFERSWSLRGMENILMDMLLDEKKAFALYESIEEHISAVLDEALEHDFEALYIGDDWGQQQGLIMGPECFRKYIKPGMSRLMDKAKRKGKTVVLHSCGDLREIMGDLIDMGVDVYNTVQPEIYDLKELKREYGRDITFYGGISTQQFLPFAGASEVRDMTLRVLDIMAKDGGYILSPTHAVTPDIPPENILAMIEASKEFVK